MDVFDDDHDHDDSFVIYHSEPDHINLDRKLLYISMVSITIVLFFLFALFLYAKCILSRQSRHRAAIRRLTLSALHVSDADRGHFFVEPPTTGLDSALIASLPTFIVRTKVPESNNNNGDNGSSMLECVVCLSPLEGDEKAKLLPSCNHFFHVGCIDTWLGSHSTCPLCRAQIKPSLQPQDREGPVGFPLDGAPASLHLHGGESSKSNGSISQLSSFRRILSRESCSTRIQPSSLDNEDVHQDLDLERQSV